MSWGRLLLLSRCYSLLTPLPSLATNSINSFKTQSTVPVDHSLCWVGREHTELWHHSHVPQADHGRLCLYWSLLCSWPQQRWFYWIPRHTKARSWKPTMWPVFKSNYKGYQNGLHTNYLYIKNISFNKNQALGIDKTRTTYIYSIASTLKINRTVSKPQVPETHSVNQDKDIVTSL